MLIRKAYWIKCDIDGCGEKWRIAIESRDYYAFDENGEILKTYLFPIDDFADARECFEGCEKVLIEPPIDDA